MSETHATMSGLITRPENLGHKLYMDTVLQQKVISVMSTEML
jgi:hypothetical protein